MPGLVHAGPVYASPGHDSTGLCPVWFETSQVYVKHPLRRAAGDAISIMLCL